VSDRFSAVAARAQTLDGFAQTLGPVSLANRYKVQQSIADGVVYISQDGGAWTPLGGGGGGGTLEQAYTAGNQIDVIDGTGPVVLDSALTGGQTLQISSVGAVATGPLVSDVAQISIDTAGFDASVNAVTVYGIYVDSSALALGVVSKSVGLFVRGPTASVAKGGPLASQKYGNMATFQNRAAYSSSITNIVRNKSAVSGSIWFLGWDETNYEFATAPSVLTDQTHMVTLDGFTNVDAITNAVEFVGLRVLIPRTTNTLTRGLTVDSQQRAGRVLEVLQDVSGVSTATGTYVRMGSQVAATAIAGQFDWRGVLGASNGIVNASFGAATILSGQTRMVLIDGLTNVDAATNGVEFVNMRILTPASDNNISKAIEIQSAAKQGYGYYLFSSATLTNTFIPFYMGMSSMPAVAQTTLGISIEMPPSTSGNTRGIRVASAQTKGAFAEFVATATSLGATYTGVIIDLSLATAGAQRVNGVDVTLPASSNSSTTGYNVTSTMTAGRFFNGSITTTLTGTLVGCEIDCATGVNVGANQAVIGGRFQVPNTSHSLAAGVVVISTQTASSCIYVNANAATGAPNGVKVTMATTISKTGQDGSAFFAAIPGAAACGLAVYPTLDGAFGQNAIQVRREATITQSFTESTALIEFLNTCAFSAGTQTFSQPQVNCGIFSTVSGATHTWSGKILQVTNSITRSSGTVTLSGRIASIEHSPTGTIGTDTTTGLAIVMTPSVSAAVVGQTTTMQSNTSFAGSAANFVWNSAAGTNNTINNAVVNVYTNASMNSGILTFFSVSSRTGSLTLTGATTGVKVDLTTNVVPGAQTLVGMNMLLGASSSASSAGIKIDSPFTTTGANAIVVSLTPGSTSNAGGILVSVSANTVAAAFNCTLPRAYNVGYQLTSTTGQQILASPVLFSRSPTSSGTTTETLPFVKIIHTIFSVNTVTYSGQVQSVSHEPIVSANGYTWSGQVALFLNAPNRSGGTADLSGTIVSISHAPVGTINTDTTTGLKVTMTPTAAFSVVGVSITMAANANGAAITIAHSGTNANQLVFTSAADGTGAHIYGPTSADLFIRTGINTGTSNGRSGKCQASDGSTTGSGGSWTLQAGAAAGSNQNGGDINLTPTAQTGSGVRGLVNFNASASAIAGATPALLGNTGGGTGPATAAQNQWLAVKIAGTINYIPLWQ
jgi:hypothetical protein